MVVDGEVHGQVVPEDAVALVENIMQQDAQAAEN
jgi:hypothetical protein